jgi:hypothetical protein
MNEKPRYKDKNLVAMAVFFFGLSLVLSPVVCFFLACVGIAYPKRRAASLIGVGLHSLIWIPIFVYITVQFSKALSALDALSANGGTVGRVATVSFPPVTLSSFDGSSATSWRSFQLIAVIGSVIGAFGLISLITGIVLLMKQKSVEKAEIEHQAGAAASTNIKAI